MLSQEFSFLLSFASSTTLAPFKLPATSSVGLQASLYVLSIPLLYLQRYSLKLVIVSASLRGDGDILYLLFIVDG